MRIHSYSFIALTFFLGGAVDPGGCFGPGPDPDTDGGNGAFEATISMSLPSGLTVADFKVDGTVVCSGVATCEHKVTSAKTYQVTATVTNGLCPTAPADIADDGDIKLVEIPCGLAPNGLYRPDDGGDDRTFATSLEGNQILLRGFMPPEYDFSCIISGNHYSGDHENGYHVEGTISDDLQEVFKHAVLVGGNIDEATYQKIQ